MDEREPWTTYGITHYAGDYLSIGVAEGVVFDPTEGMGNRLRLVSIGEGAGLFRRGGKAWPFRAPVLFCLDEREEAAIECSEPRGNLLIYFHPSVIRNTFDFETIRKDRGPEASIDLRRDAYWLKPFIDRTRPESGMLFPGRSLANRVEKLGARLAEEAITQETAYWPCRVRSFLIEMLFSIIQGEERPERKLAIADVDNELLRRFLVEIGSRYAERLTIESLARELGTNRTSLQALVSCSLGKSVAEYLASVRLDAARALLADTFLPVGEIAERSGYADASAFSRAFKQGFGVAPSEFRKAYQDKNASP